MEEFSSPLYTCILFIDYNFFVHEIFYGIEMFSYAFLKIVTFTPNTGALCNHSNQLMPVHVRSHGSRRYLARFRPVTKFPHRSFHSSLGSGVFSALENAEDSFNLIRWREIEDVENEETVKGYLETVKAESRSK